MSDPVTPLTAALGKIRAWTGPPIPTDLAVLIIELERAAAALSHPSDGAGEGLRERLLEDVSNLSRYATSTGDYVDVEDVLDVIVTRLPKDAARATRDGTTLDVAGIWLCDRLASAKAVEYATPILRQATRDGLTSVTIGGAWWTYARLSEPTDPA